MTKNEDLKAILPCPFCGGEGEYYQPNEDIAVISCLTCNAESGYYDGEDSTTPDDAVKFWNKRTIEDSSVVVTPTSQWQTMDTAPLNKYVILNISPLNYPVIAANDGNGWMTRTGAFYGVDTATLWMDIPAPPTKDLADAGKEGV